jgi:hypothetical protein
MIVASVGSAAVLKAGEWHAVGEWRNAGVLQKRQAFNWPTRKRQQNDEFFLLIFHIRFLDVFLTPRAWALQIGGTLEPVVYRRLQWGRDTV